MEFFFLTGLEADHCAYVKDRLISDALRTIDYVMLYTDLNKIYGMLVANDFEMAFDFRESEGFRSFQLRPIFIKWVKTFYNGAKSCVINNGFISHYFDLQRGVRQGDPLSPYLFIVIMEVLSISIRNENKEIKGIAVNEKEIKLVSFADDLTAFLRDMDYFHKLMKKRNIFDSCSRLKLNVAKRDCYSWVHHKIMRTYTV